MKKYRVSFLDRSGNVIATGTGFANDEEEAEMLASWNMIFSNVEFNKTEIYEVLENE